ncbi:nuclease-related domain-containing protein [Piscibacillus salipiscarius]|uniref:nuclease-related domain-containing protein n=1 Tax=Piscibacillus salipiscarius TaxID=299480 RepID=UPI0006CFC4B0|nr:nuclease-related domain-containing protein [Piscibacillus salipiscarius]
MILKELQVSSYLLQLESLIRRLPQQHESYSIVQDQIAREHAGYYGECQLIYPLSKLNFPTDLIYQLRLPYNHSFFQIDCLLMTPRFFLIIEAKNYRDLVVFNEFDQVLHKDRVYQDPVMQVEEQKYQLEMWLQMKGIPPIPIETLVTMTNSQALLKAASPNHKEKSRYPS